MSEPLRIEELRIGDIVDCVGIPDGDEVVGQKITALTAKDENDSAYVEPHHVWIGVSCLRRHVPARDATIRRDCIPVEEPAQSPLGPLQKAIHDDMEYAWSCWCNLVMPIIDAGASRPVAEEAVTNIMYIWFRYDVQAMRERNEPPVEEPEATTVVEGADGKMHPFTTGATSAAEFRASLADIVQGTPPLSTGGYPLSLPATTDPVKAIADKTVLTFRDKLIIAIAGGCSTTDAVTFADRVIAEMAKAKP